MRAVDRRDDRFAGRSSATTTEHGAQGDEGGTCGDARHQPFLDWYPCNVREDHDGPPAVAG
jgi:hypothetical protein